MEATAAIRASLQRLFGSRIEVRYYDIAQPEIRAAQAEALAMIADDRVSLPAIFLDSQLLFAGSINPLRVVGAVVEALRGTPSSRS